MGTVSRSQTDANNTETGLYVRNHYYKASQAYDASKYTVIGNKKNGKLTGPVYAFDNGQLFQVKVGNKIYSARDSEFAAYIGTAPDFKTSFNLLKKAKSVHDTKENDLIMAKIAARKAKSI